MIGCEVVDLTFCFSFLPWSTVAKKDACRKSMFMTHGDLSLKLPAGGDSNVYFISCSSSEHPDPQHLALADFLTCVLQADAQGLGVSGQKHDRNVEVESESIYVLLITRSVLLWIFAGASIHCTTDCGPYNGGSPVSQSQAIPEEAGEGRETSRTGERITHGWAM